MDFLRQYGPWGLILGGSEGVGASFARQLGQHGANLVLAARNPGPLNAVAHQVRAESGIEVVTLPVDLSAADAIEQVRRVTDALEIGLLIYNAGAQRHVAEFLDEPFEDLMKLINLNAIGQTVFSHHFGSKMRARRRGGIILVGSLSAYVGVPRMGVYSASKAFCRILAESVWFELQPYNVHVLGLMLGNTRTPGTTRSKIKLAEPIAEPDDVASEGLAHLADGPIWIAGGNEPGITALSRLSRAEAIRLVHQGMLVNAPPE